MKKKKGFTLVELLVVIAIIALLMGILMPALARVRAIAYRMVSGTNQSGIGKAIMIYANDNDGVYPVAGSRKPLGTASAADNIARWDALNRFDAYGYNLNSPSTTTPVTIGSCFYLLVKFADVTPKQFVNRADIGVTEFKLSDYTYDTANIDDLTGVWDFGKREGTNTKTGPAAHVSYSYHYPFFATAASTAYYAVSQQSSPSSPVIADRNPYLDINATHLTDATLKNPEWQNNSFLDPDGKTNSAANKREGQNVLFNDMRVSFEKYSNCGINNDNIYLYWGIKPGQTVSDQIKQMGNWPTLPTNYTRLSGHALSSRDDAFLVSDINKL